MSRKSLTTLNALSVREVMNAKPGDHTDGGGLLLRVNADATGASWVYRYTAPTGKRREMGLGRVIRSNAKVAGESLTTARALASEARELVRKGIDPLDERDRNREAAQAAAKEAKAEKAREHWTLARACRDFYEREVEPNPKITERHKLQWIASLENHVPRALWHTPIADITAPMLLEALTQAEPHERARRAGNLGETLRRIRQRLDVVLDDAVFYGRIVANPAKVIGRKLGNARPVDKDKHHKSLDYRQLPPFMAQLRAMPGTAARALELCILCTLRTSEVLNAAWSEFDLTNGLWVIPKERMKARQDHTVYLSARAVEIVRGQIGQNETFVFPSMQKGKEGQPLSNMSMLAVLDRLNMRDVATVHGFRATFSAWAYTTRAGREDAIECCLAHRESDRVKAAYSHAADFSDERRDLLAKWADYAAKPPADVVPLKVA